MGVGEKFLVCLIFVLDTKLKTVSHVHKLTGSK